MHAWLVVLGKRVAEGRQRSRHFPRQIQQQTCDMTYYSYNNYYFYYYYHDI